MGLTAAEVDELRELLLARREVVVAAAQTNDADTAVVELDQARIGRLSRMDAMQSQAMSAELKRRNERELVAIKAALARMDDDEYGDCRRCDEAISLARLRANPVAMLCIACAERGGG
jgi:DnaK suppressor protein